MRTGTAVVSRLSNGRDCVSICHCFATLHRPMRDWFGFGFWFHFGLIWILCVCFSFLMNIVSIVFYCVGFQSERSNSVDVLGVDFSLSDVVDLAAIAIATDL